MSGRLKRVFLVLCIVAHFSVDAVDHPDVELNVSPTQCVAATKGRTCHVRGHIEWQSRYPVSVCLYVSNQMQPITCWNNVAKGSSALELSLDKDVVVSISPQSSKLKLAQKRIILNWIYESNNRRRKWRLF